MAISKDQNPSLTKLDKHITETLKRARNVLKVTIDESWPLRQVAWQGVDIDPEPGDCDGGAIGRDRRLAQDACDFPHVDEDVVRPFDPRVQSRRVADCLGGGESAE